MVVILAAADSNDCWSVSMTALGSSQVAGKTLLQAYQNFICMASTLAAADGNDCWNVSMAVLDPSKVAGRCTC